VPLAVISLFVLQTQLHIHTVKRQPKIDYLGALLISITASLPLLWVTFAGKDFDWVSWPSAAYVAGTLVAGALTIFVESRAAEPLVPLKVLRNRTAALVIVASAAVGIAMFGGTTFLGQYFQVAQGDSPTTAGLLTIPLMVAAMLSSTIAGQIIGRTGRWKGFLVGGGLLLVVGLLGLSTLRHDTPQWQAGVSMGVMGLGMGALTQNLVLAVQNTVDVRDIGASSASVAFFRTLGGAVGVSALGAVLASQVQSAVASGVMALGPKDAAAAAQSGRAGSLDVKHMPDALAAIVRAAYGDATGHIFLIAALAAVVAFVAVIFVKEVPLRTTVSMTTSAEEAVSASAGAADLGERARAGVVQDDVRDVQDHIQGGSPRQVPGDLSGTARRPAVEPAACAAGTATPGVELLPLIPRRAGGSRGRTSRHTGPR